MLCPPRQAQPGWTRRTPKEHSLCGLPEPARRGGPAGRQACPRFHPRSDVANCGDACAACTFGVRRLAAALPTDATRKLPASRHPLHTQSLQCAGTCPPWWARLPAGRLAPAFTREATSRIAETPPFFRGPEPARRQAGFSSDKKLRRAAPSFRGFPKCRSLPAVVGLPAGRLALAFVATRQQPGENPRLFMREDQK
jgi:hypothetical protein